jgi:Uncharacterised BCR, YbaB family COG0718.
MLEDLITAAINAASQRIAEKAKETMAELTAGMPLPAGHEAALVLNMWMSIRS